MIAPHATPYLVIFDCDGTLIDSQHVICAAMDHAFEMQGLASPGREATLQIVGLSLFEAIHRLVPDEPPETIRALGEAYKQAFNRFRGEFAGREPLYPGARDVIEALGRRDDVLLGIATGKSRRGVDHFLEREKFEAGFATIQTADSARSKPDPEMIENALRETGVLARRAVMIGDTTYDIEMGNAGGVTTIGVGWGYHEPDALQEAGADHMAADYPELARLLDRLIDEPVA
ncbi:MAG: HAD-IA family hydrolase [Pseudomonadota bacterium]